MRLPSALLILALTALPAAQAGGDGVAGNWKVTIFEEGKQFDFWILKLQPKDGKLTGSAVSLNNVPASTLDNIDVKGDLVAFSIKVNDQVLNFEGKYDKSSKKILGSMNSGSSLLPATLEPTLANNTYGLYKELVVKSADIPQVFDVVQYLVQNAAKEKDSPKEVKRLLDIALASAAKYGERWQQETNIRLLGTLVAQEGFADLAVDLAREAEKLKGSAEYQLQVLDLLRTALTKARQPAQAREVIARLDKLESQAYAEYSQTALPFKVAKYAGRKGRTNRAVLVELFTGAQCPPCVAADLAFDALEKSYAPSEVVLLQYHLHVPRPDALTNPDSEARQSYYRKDVEGTPCVLFNGAAQAPGGGRRSDSADKFQEYCKVIDRLLEAPVSVKLQARAVRKGDKVHIRALASDVEKPGPKVRLRLALVEDWVRYRGSNGMRYHSRVVRALPGGALGLALTKKDNEQTVVVDLTELERNLNKYLDDFVKTAQEPFPDAQRPMRLRDLRVAAFVQNDLNNEVLQAVDVPVKDE
jgi:hypothetical protein